MIQSLSSGSDYQIIPARELAERLERERFPGGVNLSARDRNAAKLNLERSRVYVMASERKIICAPRVSRDPVAAIRKVGS